MAQKEDETLKVIWSKVTSVDQNSMEFYVHRGVPMRRKHPKSEIDNSERIQVVVPREFRELGS